MVSTSADVSARMAPSHISEQGAGSPNDYLVDLTVILWFCNAPLKSLVHIPLAVLGIGGLTIPVAGLVTFTPLFLYMLLEKRLPCKRFILLYALVAVFFAITLWNHPEYKYWYDRDIYGIAYTIFRPDHGALWAVLMAELCGGGKRLLNNLTVVAAVIFLHSLYLAYAATSTGYWTFFSDSGEVAQRSYDLDFGYNMAFVANIAMLYALREKRRFLWLIVVGCIFLDLRFGSRGSLLCIAVMGALWVLFSRASLRKKVVLLALLIPLAIWLLLYGESIIYGIAEFLTNSLGMESRTVTSLLQGNLFNDNGRDGIYQMAQSAIEINPYGYGAYADRALIGTRYYWGYVHNIYYEMAINFGVIGAVIVLTLIVVGVVICLVRTVDPDRRAVVFICVSMCMRLLVSDTFWGNNFFWTLIGVLLLYYWRSKPKRNSLQGRFAR